MSENRQHTRYNEIGRVTAPELCALPGVLEDISLSGCRIRFPCIISVDMEAEYKLSITLSRVADEGPYVLLWKPRWVEDYDDLTEIGMMNLYSPDEKRLKEFIEYLENLNNDLFHE